jgi:hypothetical protein
VAGRVRTTQHPKAKLRMSARGSLSNLRELNGCQSCCVCRIDLCTLLSVKLSPVQCVPESLRRAPAAARRMLRRPPRQSPKR